MEFKLSDLCIGGKGSYGIGASAVPYDPNKYTYLRITDINEDGSLNFADLKSVDDEDSYKYLLQENDIVFARTGNSTGKTYFYQKEHGCFVYAGFLIKFSLDATKVNPRILKYYTHSKEYFDWVHSFDTGGTRGNINAKTFGDMVIDLPERSVQDRIVAILSSLDAKIENNNKINANLEAQAQALFKSWFVDFEPFQNGEFVDSELGRIPKGWSINKLKEVCLNITDGVHNTVKDDINGSYYLLSAKNIKGGLLEISKNDRKINKETFEKLRRRTKLEKGDILLTSVGTIGELFILKSAPTYYEFQRSVAIIKPNKEIVCSSYIYENLKTRLNDVKNLAHGAVQQCIFIGDLKDFKLIVAPNCLIQKYEGIVGHLFEKIERINSETLRLAELRDTLLPKLMSGEIEV